LEKGDPNFPLALAGGRDSLVPHECIAEDHFSWKEFPVGAGPYRIISVANQGHTIVTEHYSGFGALEASAPRRLVFSSTAPTGEIDLAMGDRRNPDPTRLKEVVLDVTGFIWGIYFDYHSRLGANPLFRKAVALAVHRSALIKGVSHTYETAEMIPSGFEGRLGIKASYDPNGAKELLRQIPGIEEELKVPVAAVDLNSPYYSWMTSLSKQLGQVGLNIKIEPQSKPTFDPNDSQSPFFLTGYIPDVPDSFTIFRTFREGEGNPWVARIPERDRIYEALLDEDLGKVSAEERRALLTRLGERFQEQQYAVLLFEQKLTYFINPARVAELGEAYQRHVMVFERLRLK
jgi:ABC-type transport system substrate-binding protein